LTVLFAKVKDIYYEHINVYKLSYKKVSCEKYCNPQILKLLSKTINKQANVIGLPTNITFGKKSQKISFVGITVKIHLQKTGTTRAGSVPFSHQSL